VKAQQNVFQNRRCWVFFLFNAVKKPLLKNLKLLPSDQTRPASKNHNVDEPQPKRPNDGRQNNFHHFVVHCFVLKKSLLAFFLLAYNFSLSAQSRDSLAISPETYLQRLQTVGADTLKNEYEAEFVLLLDKREKRYYENLPLPERRAFIARYWRLRNPDPFAPANERLEEHLRRRDYARKHFGDNSPPHFDDRGKIYLKYGRPRMRYVDPGIYMQINSELEIFLPNQAGFINPDSGNVTAAMPQGSRATARSLLPPGSVIVLENETWCYEHVQPGLVFNFVRHGKRFKLAADLQTAVTGGRLRHRVLQTAVLYLRRQNISSVYFDLAREFEEAGQRLRSFPPELQLKLVDMQVRSVLDHNIRDVQTAIKIAPPEAFIHKSNIPELPFFAAVPQFRGKAGQTRLAINMGTNLGESAALVDSAANRFAGVTYSYILSDHNGEPVARAEQKKLVPTTTSWAPSVLGSVGVMELSCKPDQYVLFLRAAETAGPRQSLAQLPLFVRDFRGTNLMLSDIQFYFKIPDASPESVSPAEAAESKMIPYPFTTVLKSMPLTIYFEIYNLPAAGSEISYRIDYNVAEVKTDKNIFSPLTTLFRKKEDLSITLSEFRTTTQSATGEFLTLDFGKLRPSTYQLEVVVSAGQDTSALASAAKSFVLVEENP